MLQELRDMFDLFILIHSIIKSFDVKQEYRTSFTLMYSNETEY